MSLLVWLPLTNDTNNQGLSNVTVTNNGATVDNNGKLGKCYNFDGTDDRILIDGLNQPKDISVAFWIKRNANTGTRQFLFTAWGGISIELSTTGAIFGKVYSSAGETGYATGTTITTDSGWVHVVYTFQDKVGGKIYINGELKQSSTSSYSIAWNVTSGYIGNYSNIYLNAKMNDFRIYDHALSPKEVKELSKGLVCHYPLNGNGRSGDNLLKDSYINTTSSAYNITILNLNPAPSAGDKVTISIKGNLASSKYGWAIYNSGGAVEMTVLSHSTKVGDIYKKTFTWITESGQYTASNKTVNIYTYWSSTTAESSIEWVKLEYGDTATTWMPNSADTEYTKMGYDSTTEYDVSGYKYNGTRNGTLTWDANTPRYTVSTKFNGTNTYIEADPLPAETKTISVWLKTTWAYPPSGYRLAVHDKNTGLAIGWTTNQQLITKAGTSNGSAGSTTGKYIANQWNHVVVVKTGDNTRDVYINGEPITTSVSNYWGADLNKLDIGTRHYNGSYSAYWDGQMSDFRAYATALSADDIKELYNTVASITNNGTLLTRGEFVESTVSSPQITKAGLVNTEEIVESGTTTSFSKTDIKSNEYTEI